MSTLADYLAQKRAALAALRKKFAAPGGGPVTLGAKVSAEGRSGVRRIRIRDFQLVSDSPPDFAGYNLGPGSPELQLGVLGSCLTHTWLIQAADRGVPLDSLEIDVAAEIDPRGNLLGQDGIPVFPHNIRYTVTIASPASDEDLAGLEAAVDRACPILNLLRNPQAVTGRIARKAAVAVDAEAA